MKNKSIFKNSLLFLGLILLFPQAILSANDEAAAKNDTLYVIYHDTSPSVGSSRVTIIRSDAERRSRFDSNFKSVFEKEKWGVELEFKRWPFEAPEGADVLTVEILSINSPVPTEINLRYRSKLQMGSEKVDFGIDLLRGYPNIAMSSGLDHDIDILYKNAAKKVAKNLNKVLFKKDGK